MIEELNNYLQRLRKAVADIGKKTAGKLLWGYGWCKDSDDLEIIELKHAIELLRNQALNGGICICEDELDHIKSRINKLLGPICGEEEKDFTREDNKDATWILNNPDCVAYEYMADFLAAQCKKVGIDFKIIQRDCSTVGLDVKATQLLTCDAVNLALELEEKSCAIGVDVTLSLQKCIEDVTLVLTPLNCGIDLKTYVTLLNCGFTLETILEQLNCGATVQTLLTNVDSCFTEEEVDSGTAILSITCPSEVSLADFSCVSGDPYTGLQMFQGVCECTYIDEFGVPVPLPAVPLTIDMFGIADDSTVGNIRTITWFLFGNAEALNCGGVISTMVLTVSYDITDPTFVCSPPPAYQSTECVIGKYTITDPCGNTASCDGHVFVNINC